MEVGAIFKLKQKSGIKYYQLEPFSQTGLVDHCFSTKIGGVSSGDYHSLNLGLHVDDARTNVIKNRKALVELFSESLDSLVAGEQVHKTKIKVVDKQHCGRGAIKQETALLKTDALITEQKGVVLSSYYADCTPLFFLSPELPAVGLAHAGWKGTVNKIGQKTALKMEKVFNINLDTLLVGIGPHIGACCYQVGDDVIEKFAAAFDNWQELLTNDKEGQWKLDLAKANQIQLEGIGVQAENIYNTNLCTFCRDDLFYSYRRDKGETGRMASIIKIR